MPVLSGSMAKALPLNSAYLKHGVISLRAICQHFAKTAVQLKKISWE